MSAQRHKSALEEVENENDSRPPYVLTLTEIKLLGITGSGHFIDCQCEIRKISSIDFVLQPTISLSSMCVTYAPSNKPDQLYIGSLKTIISKLRCYVRGRGYLYSAPIYISRQDRYNVGFKPQLCTIAH